MTALESAALDAFAAHFDAAPTILARSPARVELLGNHTDYHGGLVLAAAIDRHTIIVGRPIPEREARVHSADMRQSDRVPLDSLERGEPGFWGNYVRGVVWAFQQGDGPLNSGFEIAIAGDVPLGAGLSSSASLQAALGVWLRRAGLVPGQGGDINDTDRMALAQRLRQSENEFVGVASGLLDQFSVLFGRADHALGLDCRSLDYERLPLGQPAPAIVVCDSTTSRRLADGMYNRRREEGERVVTYFQRLKGPEAVRQLRDVGLEELQTHWDALDPIGRRRARHVLTENERVRQGAEVLKAGDVAAFGRLMSASHASSRDDFENSSPALDALIDAAATAPGFLGGKLSGAGWAGCTVNLVAADQADAFAEAVRNGYARRQGTEPILHICRAAEGASAHAL